MAYGLRIKDGDGNIIVNFTDSNPRVLGYVDTGTSDGSHVDSRLAGGQPFFCSAPISAGAAVDVPYIEINGSTISWTFRNFTSKSAARITYGRLG